MTRRRLPDGFEVRLADDVLRERSGALLIGGSPMRSIRLTPKARSMFDPDGSRLQVRCAETSALAARLVDANLAVPVLNGPPVPSDALTVVIPVRDRPAQLDRALASLAGLRCVVVDDASRDGAAVAAVAARHGAVCVPLAANLGPAGARNAGLARVETPLVAFVDSDICVAASTLRRVARHFDDAGVALVAPQVRGRARAARPRWFERYDVGASSLTLGRRPASVRPGAAVGWLPSACLVGRVDALGDGFSPGMRVGEDVDLVWRLVAAGHVVRYDPDERADHDTRSTLRAWMGRKFLYGTGGGALGVRHPDSIAPADMPLPAAVAAAALLARRRWSLPVALSACAMTHRRLQANLPPEAQSPKIIGRLVIRGLGWALRQESSLLLRHWSPVVLAAALMTRRVRRLLLSALVVDVVVERLGKTGTDPVTAFNARRLDDLAYGSGLVVGAVRHRTLAPLMPRLR
jgi:mycofactocin system glycosyltransferase